MSQSIGFFYIRDNELCRLKNIYKIGKTISVKNRNDSFITNEHERGEFVYVLEVINSRISLTRIDYYLTHYLQSENNYINGGREYYNRNLIKLIEMIEFFLQKINIEYKVLTKEEISLINRRERLIDRFERVMPKFNHLNVQHIVQQYKIKKNTKTITNNAIELEPNEHQEYVLQMIQNFYTLYIIGKLIWACGLGKALLSILIIKLLGFKTIAFGVPSNNLQKQIKNEILKIFPNKDNILFVGGDKDDDIKLTNDTNQIKLFLNNNSNNEPKFVITTYHSCYLLVDTTIRFDFKVGDEAHHLVGTERQNRGFRLFHKIISIKTLFMTATEKIIETRTNTEIYSMDDEITFGKLIDVKNVKWAIENKKITDYSILVLKNTENEVIELVSKLNLDICNKEILIACFMCLKSLEKYIDLTHILLYTNTTEDAELAKKYIDDLLNINEKLYIMEELLIQFNSDFYNVKLFSFRKKDFYNNALHSKIYNNLDNEIYKFKNTPRGIISCVYIFGEGFDLPKLNGVCIAGNMQSETRIVQYLLRPNRLELGNPNKKAYVIIPYIDTDDWENKNKSYEKVRNIISQIRNIDENIEQKISVLAINKQIKKQNLMHEERRINYDYTFEENCSALNKLKLRLRYSKALNSKFTQEQDEYNYVREINADLNIQSKKEYVERQDSHSNFIISPEEYFKAKGVWVSWYHFMAIDTSKFIQSKQEWIKFCKKKNIKSLDDYYNSCEIYDVLPKEPNEFYSPFTNILIEIGFNRTRIIKR